MFDISLCWSISINTTCAIRIAIERPEYQCSYSHVPTVCHGWTFGSYVCKECLTMVTVAMF